MEIKGILDSITSKIGTKDGKTWTRWDFEVDGKKYGTFDRQFSEQGLKSGDYVLVVGEPDGKYFKMEAIVPAEGKPEQEHTNMGQPERNFVKKDEYHLTIEQVRSNALECAIKVTKKLGTEDYVGDLMTHAYEFEEYISNGQTTEKPEPDYEKEYGI